MKSAVRLNLCLALIALLAPAAMAQPWNGCQEQDTILLLDSSGSVGPSNWDLLETDVATALRGYDSGNGEVRLGVIQFATGVGAEYQLGDPQERETIATWTENLNFTGGFTHTRTAIERAIEQFDVWEEGQRERFLFLITDGNPYPANEQNPCDLAIHLQVRDIKVLILGIGSGWDPSSIDCLVDDPVAQIVFADDFDGILPALEQLSSIFCNAPVAVDGANWGVVKSLY